MARRIALCLLIAVVATQVQQGRASAQERAVEMDAKGEAEAKEAMRLFKQGLYEDAAKLFARLSVDYPEMMVFERNLGACFYYLRKPEPALSNLRHYLGHKRDIEPEDKATVERWIGEMEKLREQAAVVPPPAPPAAVMAPPAAFAAPPTTPGVMPPSGYPGSQVPSAETWAGQPNAYAPVPMAAAAPADYRPAVDLTNKPAPAAEQDSPFYAKWWFWTAVGVLVAGGSVATYLVLTRSGTQTACSGGSIPCDSIE
jgi:hypothetical protein